MLAGGRSLRPRRLLLFLRLWCHSRPLAGGVACVRKEEGEGNCEGLVWLSLTFWLLLCSSDSLDLSVCWTLMFVELFARRDQQGTDDAYTLELSLSHRQAFTPHFTHVPQVMLKSVDSHGAISNLHMPSHAILPVREQSADTSISLDRDSASSAISSPGISRICQCQRDSLFNKPLACTCVRRKKHGACILILSIR
jgi:hypothetical protein